MRLLKCEEFDSEELLDLCVAQIPDGHDVRKVTAARSALTTEYKSYADLAHSRQLFSARSCGHGDDTQVISGSLTKGDLTKLYTQVMMDRGGKARAVYDRLMALPPHSMCPYCELGHVSTLDHFLSKSRYPQFAVFCQNLIACCADCNKKMGGSVSTMENIGIHPYFEDVEVETKVWLAASILETSPPSASFRVHLAGNWNAALAERLRNHFKELNLAARYAVAAANELAINSEILRLIHSATEVRAHIDRTFRGLNSHKPNSWKTALYRALNESDWYINGGFAQSAPLLKTTQTT